MYSYSSLLEICDVIVLQSTDMTLSMNTNMDSMSSSYLKQGGILFRITEFKSKDHYLEYLLLMS